MNKYSTFYAAYNASLQAGNTLTKEEQVLSFTDGRTASLRELSDTELKALVQQLNSLREGKQQQPAQRMRRHIIAMAHEMRWEVEGGKVDMQRLNNWVAKYGYLHATKHSLNQYTAKQLPKLVSQFRSVYKSYLSAI